jgi:hypothetical protein
MVPGKAPLAARYKLINVEEELEGLREPAANPRQETGAAAAPQK